VCRRGRKGKLFLVVYRYLERQDCRPLVYYFAPYLIKLLNVKMEFDVGPFLEYSDSILPSFAQSHSGRKGKLRTHSAVAGVMLLDWSTSWLNWIEALGWIRSF